MATSDTALLQRWIDGRDAEAFKLVCEKYAHLPYAASYRILGDAVEAQDVTQECFEGLAALRKVPKGPFGPWLHQVATYRALNRRRGAWRRKAREQEFVGRLDAPREPDWDDIYGYVDEAITGLPEKFRVAVVAHFLEGQTHEAIARREGVSRAAITQRIQRGIERIRRSLRRRGVDVGAVALGTLMHARLTVAEPVPAAIHVGLGKLALSGTNSPLVAGSGALGGLMTVKSVVAAAAVGIGAIVGLVFVFQAFLPPTDVPARPRPAADEWKPAAARIEASATETSIPARAESTLLAGGAVSGRIYAVATGEGIANVPLRAVLSGTEEGDDTPQTVSADDGSYTLAGLHPGTYTITLETPIGYQPPADPNARIVRLEPDTTMAGCDFAILFEVPLSGIVVDRADAPVSGAEVYIRSEVFSNPVSRRRSVTTDSAGRFAFHNLVPAGTLSLQATDGVACSPLTAIDLQEAGVEELVLKLEPVASIAGRVVDPDGRPVPNIRLRLEHVTSGRHWFVSRPPTTDGQGRFAMSPLVAGKYKITLRRETTMPGISGGTKERGTIIHLTEGEQKQHLVIVYDRVYAISGTVRSESGRPVEGLGVSARARSLGGAQTLTDSAGAFTILDLPAGNYEVAVSKRARQMCAPLTGVPAGTSGLAITIPDTNQLRGRVTSARTGEVVSNFEVHVEAAGGEEVNPFSNGRHFVPFQVGDGEFTYDVNVTGPLTITVRASGFLSASRKVVVPPHGGGAKDIQFELEDSRLLNGVVVDGQGMAVAGAQIFTGDGFWTHGAEPEAVSDGEGRFTLRTVPPETFPITAVADGFAPTTNVVDGAALEDSPVRVVLNAGGMLEGSLRVAGSVPPSAAVVAEPEDGRLPKKEATVGEDGLFRIDGMAEGLYIIRVGVTNKEDTGYRVVLREAEIRNGEITLLDVELPEGTATVSGRIHDGSVAGVRGEVSLRLFTRGGEEEELFVLVDESGEFHIDGVPAGTVHGVATIRTPEGAEQAVEIGLVNVESGTTMWVDATLE